MQRAGRCLTGLILLVGILGCGDEHSVDSKNSEPAPEYLQLGDPIIIAESGEVESYRTTDNVFVFDFSNEPIVTEGRVSDFMISYPSPCYFQFYALNGRTLSWDEFTSVDEMNLVCDGIGDERSAISFMGSGLPACEYLTLGDDLTRMPAGQLMIVAENNSFTGSWEQMPVAVALGFDEHFRYWPVQAPYDQLGAIAWLDERFWILSKSRGRCSGGFCTASELTQTGQLVKTHDLGLEIKEHGLASDRESIWVLSSDNVISRFDPAQTGSCAIQLSNASRDFLMISAGSISYIENQGGSKKLIILEKAASCNSSVPVVGREIALDDWDYPIQFATNYEDNYLISDGQLFQEIRSDGTVVRLHSLNLAYVISACTSDGVFYALFSGYAGYTHRECIAPFVIPQ